MIHLRMRMNRLNFIKSHTKTIGGRTMDVIIKIQQRHFHNNLWFNMRNIFMDFERLFM